MRRLLAASAALLVATGTLSAQQATEQAVPAGSASSRRPPAPTYVGTGPQGATIRCRDGSHPAPMAADAACDGKGGVLVRYPMRAIPQAIRPQNRAAQTAQRSTAPANVPPAEGFTPWREQRAATARANDAQRPPQGATLRCADGTWIQRDTSSARCSAHGGVKARIAPAIDPARARPRGQ